MATTHTVLADMQRQRLIAVKVQGQMVLAAQNNTEEFQTVIQQTETETETTEIQISNGIGPRV